MSDEEEPDDDAGALRSVGERLGGWARRVGEIVADAAGRPIPTDAIKEPLAAARVARLQGEHAGALTNLRALAQEHEADPFVQIAMGITFVHDLLAGGRPIRPLRELADAVDDTLGRGPKQLLLGALELYGDKPDRALDYFRRAGGDFDRLPDPDEVEARFLLHLLAGLTHLRLGNEERALRELQKARARMPAEAGQALRGLVLRHGVELSLAAGEVGDAQAWIRESIDAHAEDPLARELLCRALASKGDRVGAHSILEDLGRDPSFDATRVWVGLTVGLPADEPSVPEMALRFMQSDSEDRSRRRLWALAQLAAHEQPADGVRSELIAALIGAAERAPEPMRDRYLQELAHAALRLDHLSADVVAPIEKRLGRDEGTAPEELRLVRARARLQRDEGASPVDFRPGEPPRFRADPDIGRPWGPDPRSPVRNPDLRASVLASQRRLAAAELCLARGQIEVAQDLLVDALVEWPPLQRARELLASIVQQTSGARLEDLLSAATRLLAAVPGRVLGVGLEGIQEALGRVIAARERLARPLTIAIMGEFSAGKSTFVNALLGEAVAPMGVLPTTTTINVFRRGTGGGGRVHYRDGRISTVAPEEVQAFLHGLDDTEASRIRHVEIERRGSRMGDAAVVDTPGLNALDAFHEQVAREFLDEADAVVWVFSATRSGAASEVSMLGELRAGGRQVLGVLNKVDTLDDSEQTELSEYLREQLGEVLVDIVPLRGNDALEYRTAESPSGDDPFAAVDKTLETHFLHKARELKRALTARRLGEALDEARGHTIAGIEALEQRADSAAAAAHDDRPGAPILLLTFSEAMRRGLLDVDDVLLREGLGLGLLRTGEGVAKGPLDPLDAEYLGACLRDAAIAALQRTLVDVARQDVAASEVLDRVYVPWARGHLEGLLEAHFIQDTLREHGKKIAEGETPMRNGFRESLRPVADAWAEHARGLVYAVERARNRSDRQAASAPRAEALRLRTGVLAAVDALAEATKQVNG